MWFGTKIPENTCVELIPTDFFKSSTNPLQMQESAVIIRIK